MRIQHNILAMNAYRNYTNNTSALSKNLEKLSSGYKINRAGDDAAGLAISEKMRAQITGLNAAQKNVKDGVSLVKTAEGALSEVHDMLNRMVSLATQSANGTYDSTDRVQLQKELDQLRTEINRISEASNFNGIKLLDGSMDASGGVKNVDSLSRMLQTVGTGVENIGKVTILDSDPDMEGKTTKFEMNFEGLYTGAAKSDDPNTYTFGGVTVTKYGPDVKAEFSFDLKALGTIYDGTTLQIGDGTGNVYHFKFAGSGGVTGSTGVSLQSMADGGGTGSAGNPFIININDTTVNTAADLASLIASKINGGTVGFGNMEFEVEAKGDTLAFTAQTAGFVNGIEDGDAFAQQVSYTDGSGIITKSPDPTPQTHPQDVHASVTNYGANNYASFSLDLTGLTNGAVIKLGDKYYTLTGASGVSLQSNSVNGGTGISTDPYRIAINANDTASAVASAIINHFTQTLGSTTIRLGDKNFTVNHVGGKLTFVATTTGEVTLPNQTTAASQAEFASWLEGQVYVDNTQASPKPTQPTQRVLWSTDSSGFTAGVATSAAVQGATAAASYALNTSNGWSNDLFKSAFANGYVTLKAKLQGDDIFIKISVNSSNNGVDNIKIYGTNGSGEIGDEITDSGFKFELDTTNNRLVIKATAQGTNAAFSPANIDNLLTGIAYASMTSSAFGAEGTNFSSITGGGTPNASTPGATAKATTAGSAYVEFAFASLQKGDVITLAGSVAITVTEEMANATSAAALATLITNALTGAGTTALDAKNLSVTVASVNGKVRITLTETRASGSYGATIGAAGTFASVNSLFSFTPTTDPQSLSNPTGIELLGANEGISTQQDDIVTYGEGDGNDEGGEISFNVQLGGKSLVDNVKVKGSSDAKAIAEAVWKALASKADVKKIDDNTLEVKLAANGATYHVTASNGKLVFELQDAPTKDNIKGNFDWNLTGETDRFGGGHTSGMTVHTQGRVSVENQNANTIFRIDSGDIKDGAKITITDHNGKSATITLNVGRKGQDSELKGKGGTGVVYLTDEEAKDLDYVLGKISAAIGSRVGDLIIGVNNKANGQGHMGLTVEHAHSGKLDSKDAYLTMEDFAKVFSMTVPRNPGGTGLTLQIGDTADAYNQLQVSIGACDTAALGLDGVDISTQQGAQKAIESIKNAINVVSDIRGTLGATQNRLEHTQNNLSVMAENIQDAESTIRDTDVAEEMMQYVKNNILIQSAQAMLAQANQIPQGVLQLLG